MKAGGELKAFAVRALARCNGQPLPEETMAAAVRLAFPHVGTPEQVTAEVLQHLEAAGYVVRGLQEFTDATLWALTDKGRLAAAAMR